jgi:hypothetical protein
MQPIHGLLQFDGIGIEAPERPIYLHSAEIALGSDPGRGQGDLEAQFRPGDG